MLQGKTIAITRSEEDSEEFVELVSKENAKPIPLPTIELVTKGEKIVDEFLESTKQYDPDYSVFMSSKAVKLLFDSSKKISMYEKLQLAVANTIVIAVGPKTKSALEAEGIKVSHMPKRFSSVGVGEVFTRLNAVGKKVIVPRSGASTPFLKTLLEIMKKDYDEKTLLNNLQKTKIVSIGPFTSEELNKLDLQNTVADVHTVPGAFETIKNIFSLA